MKLGIEADAPESEIDEDILDLDEDLGDQGAADDQDALDPDDLGGDDQGDEDGVDITLGDEEAAPASTEKQGSELVKHLRAEIRKRDALLAGTAKPEVVAPIVVGEKPTMESCDYDEAKFETELDAWKERDKAAKEQVSAATEKAKAGQAAWLQELQGHEDKKKALNIPGFEIVEEAAIQGLSQLQQAIVVKAADDSAKVIYALGRFPKKLAELGAIEDPIKFAKAIINLEKDLKVTPRRQAAEPDEPVRGSAPLSKQSGDKHLAKLETDAAKTGDRTKVIAYKKQLRDKGSK